jgi:AraC-like DNA-binding protein
MIYGATFGYIYENNSEIINHLQVLFKSLMVIYIVQAAFLNSSVFKQKALKLHKINLSKYLNSSLTESLSEELKQELIRLFKADKVYRDCNLNLETLSKKLNTTRHNTSQIINEHFGMNFFELVNKFRIKEAIKLLENADVEHVNIIDIAYEVGFNNKVTFNKAFKKSTSLTPTQFIEYIKNDDLVSV